MTDAEQELEKRTTVRIPADCSKCDNGGCTLRHTCNRWLAKPHTRQVYSSFRMAPDDEGCAYHWPVKEEKDGGEI
jgi:hypothetical protein